MTKKLKKILILGGGPSGIGQECELDSAALQAMHVWNQHGIEVFLLDNNPYSVMIQELNSKRRIIAPVNTENAKQAILDNQIDGITATFGDVSALKVIQRLNKNNFLSENNVEIVGLNKTDLDLFNNSEGLNERLAETGVPTLTTYTANNYNELRDLIQMIPFPVLMKPIDPDHRGQRHVFQNMEELTDGAERVFEESKVKKCTIKQEIVGYREFGMVGIRDTQGTKILIDSLEDMNSVGISSNDSVVFAPAQTLTDEQLQLLRATTFNIMDNLGIKGTCHVQFALDTKTNNMFVLKVNPKFNTSTSVATEATGYPLALVAADLMLGVPVTEVKLPRKFQKFTPILQPISDHVAVKVPIWPFEQLQGANRKLSSKGKQIGAVIGVGRSCEAALLKGIRSSQSSPKDILPSYDDLSEDELVQELIHPTDEQLPILFEAIRRHYSVRDLSELTKIDSFFITIIKNIDDAEAYIERNPNDLNAISIACRTGFGEGMISNLWGEDFYSVRKKQIRKTYKMIEPTAGEFDEQIDSFYSSFEQENESHQIGNHTALVIGKGRNKLGPNIASDTYTSEVLIQLKKLGFNTIILNNNPNSATLSPLISDKQYIDPVQLGEILDVINLEHPQYVFVPGNRHFLIRELKKLKNTKIIVCPPDQKNAVKKHHHADFGFDFLVTKDGILPLSSVGFKSENEDDGDKIENQTDYYVPYGKEKLPVAELIARGKDAVKKTKLKGIVQVLFYKDGKEIKISAIQPLRISETILLGIASKINWIGVLVKLATGTLDFNALAKRIPKIDSLTDFTVMQATFPFKQLGINDVKKNRSLESGAKISVGDTIADAKEKLLR